MRARLGHHLRVLLVVTRGGRFLVLAFTSIHWQECRPSNNPARVPPGRRGDVTAVGQQEAGLAVITAPARRVTERNVWRSARLVRFAQHGQPGHHYQLPH